VWSITPGASGALFICTPVLISRGRILAVSHCRPKRDLSREFGVPEEKIEVVYTPRRTSCASRCPRCDRVLERHATDPLCFTRKFKPQKNCPRLIEAFAVAKADLRDHPLYAIEIAFDRRFRGGAFGLARAVLPVRVQGDVRSRIRAHPVLRVFYSARRRSFSVSLRRVWPAALEAMAHGTPVLTRTRHRCRSIRGRGPAGESENVFGNCAWVRQILTEK